MNWDAGNYRTLQRRSLLAVGAVVAPLLSAMGQSASLPRVGLMATAPLTPSSQPIFDAFMSGVAEAGMVVDRDFILERRYHGGDGQKMAAQAAELVALGVRVIVAPSTQTALAAKAATRNIPIVFIGAGDPIGSGLAQSLAHPAGNVTGVSSQGVDFALKQFELMREVVPASRRIAVMVNPENQPHASGLSQIQNAAVGAGIEIVPVVKRNAADIEAAIKTAFGRSCDALIVFDDAVTNSPSRRDIIRQTIELRLPSMYQWRFYVAEGGLMSFGPVLTDLFKRGGTFIPRLLRGGSPEMMPIEQPTRFELVINLKTAKAIGLTIKPTVLARADEVIE